MVVKFPYFLLDTFKFYSVGTAQEEIHKHITCPKLNYKD